MFDAVSKTNEEMVQQLNQRDMSAEDRSKLDKISALFASVKAGTAVDATGARIKRLPLSALAALRALERKYRPARQRTTKHDPFKGRNTILFSEIERGLAYVVSGAAAYDRMAATLPKAPPGRKVPNAAP